MCNPRERVGTVAANATVLLGLRGWAMTVLALGYFLLGLSVLIGSAPAPPGAFHGLFPEWFAVGMWWVTGAVAAVTAWTRDRDFIGIAALTIMPVIRALSFGGSWVVSLLPPRVNELLPGDPVEGSGGSWLGMSYSLLLLAFVIVVAFIHDIPAPSFRRRKAG